MQGKVFWKHIVEEKYNTLSILHFLLFEEGYYILSLLVSKKYAYERHTRDEILPQIFPNYSVKGLFYRDGLTLTFGGLRIQ